MAARQFDTVDDYLSVQTDQAQTGLRKIRAIVHKTVKDLEEVISYQMPTIKKDGKVVLHFAAFTHHYSVFLRPKFLDEFREELSNFRMTKSAVNIPYGKSMPVSILTRMVKYIIAMNKEQLKAKRMRSGGGHPITPAS